MCESSSQKFPQVSSSFPPVSLQFPPVYSQFPLISSSFLSVSCRPPRDGGSRHVHAGLPGHGEPRPSGLEALQLGLRLVLLVRRWSHSRLLHYLSSSLLLLLVYCFIRRAEKEREREEAFGSDGQLPPLLSASLSLMKKAQSSHVMAGLGFGVQSPTTGQIGIA